MARQKVPDSKCDLCGKEMASESIHSGDGKEELCHECYHNIYDIDEEVDE